MTLNEDNCIHTGNYSPANWAMMRQFLVSVARQFDCQTMPDALRLMANQVNMVFDVLFPRCTDNRLVLGSPND